EQRKEIISLVADDRLLERLETESINTRLQLLACATPQQRELYLKKQSSPEEAELSLICSKLKSDWSKNDTQNFQKTLSILGKLMDSHATTDSFISISFRSILYILTQDVYGGSKSLMLPESKKSLYFCLGELFQIVDRHIQRISKKEPLVCLDLKTRLANL